MPIFLAVTTADSPDCPAGSALQRIELDEPFSGWPGIETIPDDGRELWVAPPPPPAVPHAITNFQARATLMQLPSATAGRTLFEDVDDAMHAAGGTALQAWEYANEVYRDGALVASLGEQLALSPAEMDQLFITASGIVA